MTIFSSCADARKSLAVNKWAYTEWPKGAKGPVVKTLGDLDDYLEDFARIAAFLCNMGRFQPALVNVSALMWAEYVKLHPTLRNRFTRALGAVAVNNGFTFVSGNEKTDEIGRLENRVLVPEDAGMLSGLDQTQGYCFCG